MYILSLTSCHLFSAHTSETAPISVFPLFYKNQASFPRERTGRTIKTLPFADCKFTSRMAVGKVG